MSPEQSPADQALQRRQRALREKLLTLPAEAAAWNTLPSSAGFEIHTSQIEAVCGGLTALHALIVKEIDEAEYPGANIIAVKAALPGALSLEQIVGFERRMLAALEIWNAYREKFAFRMIPEQRQTLALMDDLAWHAYRPVRDRAVGSGSVELGDVRQPPLVFPNPRWSPFARSREQRYELSEESGNWEALDDLDDWLRTLPVPLIGIPWYQVAHLPDAVFVGHEVGHLIEEDFHLEEALRAAIVSALPAVDDRSRERQVAWSRHWRSEVFADVYGVLTTGPAYAAVLIDTLHGGEVEVEQQPNPNRVSSQQWSAYPTRALRAHLVCEAVKQLPDPNGTRIFATGAEALLKGWRVAYPKHAMQDYDQDVPQVVKAIVTTAFDEFAAGMPKAPKSLTDVVTFTPAMQQKAVAEARRALGRETLVETDDRILVAAAALAFLQDPAGATAVDAGGRFRARLLETRQEEVRLDLTAAGNVGEGETPEQAAQRHEKVAAALWKQLSSSV